MGRIVRCPIENQVIANSDGVLDIFELIAGANKPIDLVKFRFESSNIAADNVRLRMVRRSTTGSGGVTGVPVKNNEGGGTITAVVEFDVTTVGSVGDILAAYQWEQLGPLEEIYLPEERIHVQEGGRLCLEIVSAIPNDANWSGYVVWME